MIMESMASKPQNLFLDRYLPKATPEEHVRAHENLQALACALAIIDARLEQEKQIRSNRTGEVDSA